MPLLPLGVGHVAPIVTLEFGARSTSEPLPVLQVACDIGGEARAALTEDYAAMPADEVMVGTETPQAAWRVAQSIIPQVACERHRHPKIHRW